MRIILGTQSPRRVQILRYFALPFEQRASHFDEASIPFEGDPEAYVEALALAKARHLGTIEEDTALITADTIVYYDGEVYGKPKSDEEALAMLRTLAGNWHTVYSAITLRTKDASWTGVEATRVLFHKASDEHLRSYIQDVHSADKAGAYAIQDAGSIIVKKIDGCFYNVMGFPIQTLETLLQNIGMSLWDHLASAQRC